MGTCMYLCIMCTCTSYVTDIYCYIFALSDQRETLIVQVPKGNNARKNGWKDMVRATISLFFLCLSHTHVYMYLSFFLSYFS